MNKVNLIGRLTKDPEVKYSQSGMAVARFSVAIGRGKDKDGNDKGADFPNIVVFGKSAEFCEKYMSKGDMVAVSGKIQTGSYEKQDGTKVYTTEVVADSFGGIEKLSRSEEKKEEKKEEKAEEKAEDLLGDLISDDVIPF